MSLIWTPPPRKIWTPSRRLQRGFVGLPGGMGATRPSGGGGTDPLNSDVVLRCHFDGTNGSTTLTDTSPTPKTLTAFGNCQISTAQSVFGGASCSISSASATINNRAEVNHHSQLNLAGSDFCIEARFLPATLHSGIGIFLAAKRGLSSAFEYSFYYFDGTLGFWYSTNGTTIAATVSRTWTPTTGAWNGVAVNRNGSDLQLFAAGTQLGATYNIGSAVFHSGSEKMGIFSDRYNATQGNIWMDELRITKASRRTSNYTLDASAFPDS